MIQKQKLKNRKVDLTKYILLILTFKSIKVPTYDRKDVRQRFLFTSLLLSSTFTDFTPKISPVAPLLNGSEQRSISELTENVLNCNINISPDHITHNFFINAKKINIVA